jgi:hypothetical protein
MLATAADAFERRAMDVCIECHEGYGSRFADSYHGKAALLGSDAAATCAECHTAHAVLPAADPGSSVADSNLIETCGACHDHARAGFVDYDAHPDPTDRERNPYIFYSFWFMNSLLIGVLAVFGLHTVLWWIRIVIDRRRGVSQHGGAA